MQPASPPLTRRAALGVLGGLAIAALSTACSGQLGDRVPEKVTDGLDRLRAPRTTPPAPANPDQPVVDAVVAATAELRATLLAYRPRDPWIAELAALHRAHLAALGAPKAQARPVPLDATDLLGQIRSREQALATLVSTKAVAAQDPQLARLLAAMAAALAQRTAGAAG